MPVKNFKLEKNGDKNLKYGCEIIIIKEIRGIQSNLNTV